MLTLCSADCNTLCNLNAESANDKTETLNYKT